MMKIEPGLERLRMKGSKRKAQRDAILKVLRKSFKPLTALEVLNRVQSTVEDVAAKREALRRALAR